MPDGNTEKISWIELWTIVSPKVWRTIRNQQRSSVTVYIILYIRRTFNDYPKGKYYIKEYIMPEVRACNYI